MPDTNARRDLAVVGWIFLEKITIKPSIFTKMIGDVKATIIITTILKNTVLGALIKEGMVVSNF